MSIAKRGKGMNISVSVMPFGTQASEGEPQSAPVANVRISIHDGATNCELTRPFLLWRNGDGELEVDFDLDKVGIKGFRKTSQETRRVKAYLSTPDALRVLNAQASDLFQKETSIFKGSVQ